MLANFRWWRKLRGGHWEYWYLTQGNDAWFRLKECSIGGARPFIGCRGIPRCETYGTAMDL